MRLCENCDLETPNMRCPRCQMHTVKAHDHEPLPRTNTFVSDPPGSLDDVIEAASRPSLASLVKAGLKRGLIQPIHDYASKISK